MTEDDERIDFERLVVEYASNLAIDKLCDVLHVASEQLRQMRFSIAPGHTYNRKFCPRELHALGVGFARSTIESMIDEPPIDFRSAMVAVLEGDESVMNEDDVIDRIRDRVLGQLRTVVK